MPKFKALILEYMPNGSLQKWLYSEYHSLNFLQRLDIIIYVALSLDYLHNGYSVPVVHCDLKSSNVILNEDMIAHVSDFRKASRNQGKHGSNSSHSNNRVHGTRWHAILWDKYNMFVLYIRIDLSIHNFVFK